MENRTAYSALASCYDALMKEEDYAAQTAHLTALLKAHGAGKKGLDLGCGSGTFTLALAKAGYRMTGVDLSQEMLTVAQNRCAGYPVSFFLQDIASLRLPEKYDFMTAVTDGFNYVPQKKAATALKKMAAHLTQGGLLYLDLSSAYKLREVLGNNLFGEDDENLSYLWFNRLEEDRVEMDLSFFFRQEDGKFVKREEHHVQYVYEKDFLTQLLEHAGFTVLSVTDKNGQPYTEASHRMQILARLN